MAIKIGEMLVKAGLVTPAQLDEALKNQVIFGGKLGTNLIEIGAIEEEDLAKTLSAKLGVPYAPPDALMSISADLIRMLPKTIAQQYRVIPFNLEKNRLSLVMADPSDLGAIDEIAFITGFIVRPFVTPEVRLALALEKYYQVRRDLRYIKIADRTTRTGQAPERKAVPPPPAQPQARPQAPAAAAPRPVSPAPPVAAPPAAPKPAPPAGLEELELVDLDMEALEEKEAVAAAKREEAVKKYSVDTLSEDLSEVKDREQVADIIIGYTGEKVAKGALFLIRGNSVTAWRAISGKKRIEEAEKFGLTVEDPSVLKIVVDGKSPYLGPVADTPENRKLLSLVGAPPGARASFIPLVMMGRVVNVLMAVVDEGDPAATVQDLQTLMKKAALSFEILILKNKILMT